MFNTRKTSQKSKTKLNDKEVPNLIAYSIKPTIILENIYGIFRYRIVKGQVTKTNMFMNSCAIFMILIFVIPYVVWFTYFIRFEDFSGSEGIMEIVEEIPVFLMLVKHVLTIITFMYINKKNVILFKTFETIDYYLNISKNKHFHTKIRMNLQIALIIFLVLYTISFFYDFFQADTFTLYNVLHAAIDFEGHLEVFAFYTHVKILVERIVIVNLYLENFIKAKENLSKPYKNNRPNEAFYNNAVFIGSISSKNNKITTLTSAFDAIGEAGKLINEVFNFQIFLTVLYTFFFIILSIWTAVFSYRSTMSVSIFDNILECTEELLSIVIMCYICELLYTKRNMTKRLINELIMSYELPKSIRVQAKSFMELVNVWPLELVASEMFCVNIKLLVSFVSVLTTYLIVMLQLSHFL